MSWRIAVRTSTVLILVAVCAYALSEGSVARNQGREEGVFETEKGGSGSELEAAPGTLSSAEAQTMIQSAYRADRSTRRPFQGGRGRAVRLGFLGGNDYEPLVAADGAGHVYVVWIHYPGDTAVDPSAGAVQRIYIQVSDDWGKTFGAHHVVNELGGITQQDPAIALDSVNPGVVYVLMKGVGNNDNYVAKSTDYGATFPTFQKVSGGAASNPCGNCTRGSLLAYNNNVYAAYGGGTGGIEDHYLSRSADGGATWTETRVFNAPGGTYTWMAGSAMDAAHNAWFIWSDCVNSGCTGAPAVQFRISQTLAGTSTTTNLNLLTAPEGPSCTIPCTGGFYSPQADIDFDAAGKLYWQYQTALPGAPALSPSIMELGHCTTNCAASLANWTTGLRVDDKWTTGCTAGACTANFPSITATESGQITALWMDNRSASNFATRLDGWNTWWRTSIDGGATWQHRSHHLSKWAPSRPASALLGYKNPGGDYFGSVALSSGAGLFNCDSSALAAVWGESQVGERVDTQPGNVIFARRCLD